MKRINSLGDMTRVIRAADPADKAELYRDLRVHLTYHPDRKTVIAEADTSAIVYKAECPRVDLNPQPIH